MNNDDNTVRLAKRVADMVPCSRREAENYIEGAYVTVDGEIVEDEHFPTLLVDIALLRSLNIRIVLVHGASFQLRRLAEEQGASISNADGTGITDATTLRLALTVANRLTHEILEGLASNDLRAACTNAVVAHPAGILRGIDMQLTGKVERSTV